MIRCLSAVFLCLALNQGYAQTVTLESSTAQVNLLELYTSEGCSSCPPADRWISKFTNHGHLWDRVVPIAFHVDYWDYIGWKDRFALPAYSERQRRYARQGMIRTVYTPGFVLNGAEWRGWFTGKQPDIGVGGEVGKLRVEIVDGEATVTYLPVGAPSDDSLDLHVAILGFDLETKVKAGENEGRSLRHNFAVLAYGLSLIQRTENAYGTTLVLPDTGISAPTTALAAWVTPRGGGKPIQAVGGWLADTDS